MRCKRPFSLAVAVAGLLALLLPGTTFSAQMFFYPARGQSPQQQQQDQGDCHMWAVQQSGFNPGMAQAPPPQQAPNPGASVLGGAARGAALGAVGGAIAGDAGKGAAAGAAMGGLFGGMRYTDQVRAQQQTQAQQQQMMAQQQATYQRALAACMSGRGYSVQ